jgi:hypothetical protein
MISLPAITGTIYAPLLPPQAVSAKAERRRVALVVELKIMFPRKNAKCTC